MNNEKTPTLQGKLQPLAQTKRYTQIQENSCTHIHQCHKSKLNVKAKQFIHPGLSEVQICYRVKEIWHDHNPSLLILATVHGLNRVYMLKKIQRMLASLLALVTL